MIDERTIAAPKVIVYGTKTCPYCAMAKRYLADKGVSYIEYDVGADHSRAQEMMGKTGQRGVPVLDINGIMIIGFDRAGIDRALSSNLPLI